MCHAKLNINAFIEVGSRVLVNDEFHRVIVKIIGHFVCFAFPVDCLVDEVERTPLFSARRMPVVASHNVEEATQWDLTLCIAIMVV